MKSMLSAVAVLALTAGQALAGSVPGPEMGEGYAGLTVLAAVAAGYVAVRRLRRNRAR